MNESFTTEHRRLLPLAWIILSCLLLIADFFSGPFIQFPITYLIPVALAAWFNGFLWGLAFSILLPGCRLIFNLFYWDVPWTVLEAATNFIIRVGVFSAFSFLIARVEMQQRKLKKDVEMLSGLLPICAHCKKIQDTENQWIPVEKYISHRSAATFSHGFCPDCIRELYGK